MTASFIACTFFIQHRFATLLAACMTFNTFSLPSRSPKSFFCPELLSKTHSRKSAFYEQANAVYFHNLILVVKMLQLKVQELDMSRSLFTTTNATHNVLSYMSSGIYAEWDEMVASNKNAKGKATSCTTVVRVIELFFLVPPCRW